VVEEHVTCHHELDDYKSIYDPNETSFTLKSHLSAIHAVVMVFNDMNILLSWKIDQNSIECEQNIG
jgi:hypothetical protein